MDIERPRRAELIRLLGSDFDCREEVLLRHAMFATAKLRADVVAVVREGEFAGTAIAFEVKEPSASWQDKRWLYQMRQAADYVYARIDPRAAKLFDPEPAGRIMAAFVFPAPPIRDFGLDGGTEPMLGAATLALHFRVGQARQSRSHRENFSLAFANNEIWQSDKGFKAIARQFLDGRYRLGAGDVDATRLLDERDSAFADYRS